VRRTNTPICILAWPAQPARKVFEEIADWFETLAKAERSHAGRFTKALNELA
jgi:rubrerythrin